MSAAAAPWSVKGIDPKAREVAKDLARRSGMTLGEWLNTMIMDDEDDGVQPLPRRPHAAEMIDRRGRSRRVDDAYDLQGRGFDRDEEMLHRVAASVDAIAARLEAAERRSTVAIQGVDQAVAGLVRKMEAQDQQAGTVGRRVEDISDELKEGHKRLRRFEQEAGPKTAESITKIEQALGGLAGRLYDMEERQRSGLNEVRQRLEGFEQADIAGRTDTAVAALTSRLYDLEERNRAHGQTLLARLDAVEASARSAPAPSAPAATPSVGPELLARVGERLDAAQGQTTEALRSLERSFAGLDQRLRATETRVEPEGAREAAQFEKLAETLSRQVDANRIEMMRRLETAESEGRLVRIETAVQSLGEQARVVEQRAAEGIDAMGREVLRIAKNLDRRIHGFEDRVQGSEARVQGAEAGVQAVEGRIHGIEDRVRNVELGVKNVELGVKTTEAGVQGVEARLQGAETGLNGVVTAVDARLARLEKTLTETLSDKISNDMSRYGQAIDHRLNRADDQHAIALEKLGVEISRISDRLTDRIAQSERKSAQALEDISRRMSEGSDRIEQRYDRASGELAERMRMSEERTSKLLAQARGNLEQRAAAGAEGLSSFAIAETAARPDTVTAQPDWRAAAFPNEGFAEPAYDTAPGGAGWSIDPLAADLAPFPDASNFEPEAEPEPSFDSLPRRIETAQVTPEPEPEPETPAPEPIELAATEPLAAEPPAAEPQATEPQEPVRFGAATSPFGGFGGADVSDALEATAQAAPAPNVFSSVLPEDPPADRTFDDGDDDFAAETEFVDMRRLRPSANASATTSAAASSTSKAINAARAAMSAPTAELQPTRSGFGLGGVFKKGGKSRLQERLDKQAARDGGTAKKAFLASITGMAVIGGLYATGRLTGHDMLNVGQMFAGEAEATPLAALALSSDAVVDASPTSTTEAQTLFAQATEQLDRGDAAGVRTLTRAANLGEPQAQLKLAGLYQSGENGVTADPEESRLWARRAAEGGDARGMHAFGMYLFDGVGGARNRPEALNWLVKAANRGLVDSQYNVARIYENGDEGIAPNPVQAYRWYLIASRAGDPQAQSAVDRLAPMLPAAQRQTARAQAEAFALEPLA